MKNKVVCYGILGIIGVIGVGIGEFLMHYNPQGYGTQNPIAFFNGISKISVTRGHYLVVLCVPLYVVAYRHLYYILREAKQKMATYFFGIAMYIFIIGGVWIGSRSLLYIMYVNGFDIGLDFYEDHVEVLLQLLRLGVLTISILYAYVVWTGETLLPRWMAFVNPASILTLVFLVFFAIPSIGKVLVPTAMNVSHFIFLSFTLYFSLKRARLFLS